MNIATMLETHERLLPALELFAGMLRLKRKEFEGIVKIGRTHT